MSIQDIILSDQFKSREDFSESLGDTFAAAYDVWENAERLLNKMGLSLPPFMTFPEPPPLYTISWDPEREVFYAPGYDGTSSSLSALHDEIVKGGADVLFNEESFEGAPDVDTDVFLSDGNRLLIGWLDPRPYAANAYWDFLEAARRYLSDPQDFHSAFYFMDLHPMFWYQTEHENWLTEYGRSTLSTDVFMVDGKVRIGLEGGSTVPGTTYHYHDPKLDVYADTFEEAYITFAAKIHEYHDLDGTERKHDK